ncbi:MAG: 2-phospho-L-lactate transferase [Acidobacteria bacterium]|nr:2-phospho-L-lactate transferase [Acidobacteriota bacterium]
MMITALAGGVGGAKFLLGLSRVLPPSDITVIGNTGDDIELYGLHICPDLDTIAYTLGGRANPDTGWGLAGESWICLQTLRDYGSNPWFQLGDRDLAAHLWRTQLLKEGRTLTEITSLICNALGVKIRLLPMTDSYVPTRVVTKTGERLHIQEYLVLKQSQPIVREIEYSNIAEARAADAVLQAISRADMIVICPSNPFISIGPILAVPGIQRAIAQSLARVVAISPIIAGQALKGPAAKMLQELGFGVSAAAVARYYQDLADVFVLDWKDKDLCSEIETLGMRPVLAHTIMNTIEDKIAVARKVLEIA